MKIQIVKTMNRGQGERRAAGPRGSTRSLGLANLAIATSQIEKIGDRLLMKAAAVVVAKVKVKVIVIVIAIAIAGQAPAAAQTRAREADIDLLKSRGPVGAVGTATERRRSQRKKGGVAVKVGIDDIRSTRETGKIEKIEKIERTRGTDTSERGIKRIKLI